MQQVFLEFAKSAQLTRIDLYSIQIKLNECRKLRLPLSKAVESVFDPGRFSWVGGPSMLNPNNFPNLPRNLVFLPPVDDKQQPSLDSEKCLVLINVFPSAARVQTWLVISFLYSFYEISLYSHYHLDIRALEEQMAMRVHSHGKSSSSSQSCPFKSEIYPHFRNIKVKRQEQLSPKLACRTCRVRAYPSGWPHLEMSR